MAYERATLNTCWKGTVLSVPEQRYTQDRELSWLCLLYTSYIVVPIFLMLSDGDAWLKSVFEKMEDGILLNNLVVLSIVYAATALPFTIYLLSGYFATLAHDYEEIGRAHV